MTVNAINNKRGYNVITLHSKTGDCEMSKKIKTIRLVKDVTRLTDKGTNRTFKAGEEFDVVGEDASSVTVDTPPIVKGGRPWRIVLEKKRREFEEGDGREPDTTADVETASDGATVTTPAATVTRPTPTVGSTVSKP